jgi:hypothetical protein
MFIECICNFGAINIRNRPENNQNNVSELNLSTYHIVAMTPWNPANNSVAPR